MPPTEIRTILTAVSDPASSAQPTVERAAQVAEPVKARMILFHVAFETALAGRPFFDTKRLARSRGAWVTQRTKELERHAEQLRRTGLDVETRVVWEEPAHEAIVRAAIREDVDLLVAGHAGRKGPLPNLRLTDWELLRMCTRPLLLVRSAPTGEARTRPVLAALDPTHANDKPASLDVSLVSLGVTLATALGVEIHAVHCVPLGAYPLGHIDEKTRSRMHESAQKKLQRVLKRGGAPSAQVHVLEGAVEDVVPRLASELNAQMLVLGALSRRGLSKFAVGNTAERIISDAPCDLLIVKPETFRLRLGRTRKQEVILPTEA